PPLQPLRLHASEVVHDLLSRKLDELRPADVHEADEADPPGGGLLVGLHGERQRGGREAPRYIGRKPRPLEEQRPALDGRRRAAAERLREAGGGRPPPRPPPPPGEIAGPRGGPPPAGARGPARGGRPPPPPPPPAPRPPRAAAARARPPTGD